MYSKGFVNSGTALPALGHYRHHSAPQLPQDCEFQTHLFDTRVADIA